jgi:hypothetical protein
MTPKPRNRAGPTFRRGESPSEAYQLTMDALDNLALLETWVHRFAL